MKQIIIILIIMILAFFLIYEKSFEQEDVNKDREVNALDLLIVQKYILEEE